VIFGNSANGPYLFQALIDLLQPPGEPNSLIVDVAFAELVKALMRNRAAFEAVSQADLLRDAIDQATRSLAHELEQYGAQIDFAPYISYCQAKLKAVAREMADLSLAAAQREPPRQEPRPLMTEGGTPYLIHRITSGSQIDGLYAVNLRAADFRMTTFREKFRITETWFPFLVWIEERLFVVERGSVFVNLKGVPENDWEQARTRLKAIMDVAFGELETS
jgi:hypothetical protein